MPDLSIRAGIALAAAGLAMVALALFMLSADAAEPGPAPGGLVQVKADRVFCLGEPAAMAVADADAAGAYQHATELRLQSRQGGCRAARMAFSAVLIQPVRFYTGHDGLATEIWRARVARADLVVWLFLELPGERI